jgi:hypothetical protein
MLREPLGRAQVASDPEHLGARLEQGAALAHNLLGLVIYGAGLAGGLQKEAQSLVGVNRHCDLRL